MMIHGSTYHPPNYVLYHAHVLNVVVVLCFIRLVFFKSTYISQIYVIVIFCCISKVIINTNSFIMFSHSSNLHTLSHSLDNFVLFFVFFLFLCVCVFKTKRRIKIVYTKLRIMYV